MQHSRLHTNLRTDSSLSQFCITNEEYTDWDRYDNICVNFLSCSSEYE